MESVLGYCGVITCWQRGQCCMHSAEDPGTQVNSGAEHNTPSLSQSVPSGKLERVRSALIEESGMVVQFPVPMAQYTLSIVNDYLGPDSEQEIEISRGLGESFVPEFLAQMKNYLKLQDPIFNKMFEEMESTLKKVALSFPFMSSIEMEFGGPLQQDVLLEIAKAWVSIVESNSGLFSAEEKQSIITFIQRIPLESYFSEMEKYAKKEVILKEDRPYLAGWVRAIIASQNKFNKLIPPIPFTPGDSHGITFEIKKANRVYGYLYGTIHHLHKLPELKIVTQISMQTLRRLLDCAIIGTEVSLPNEPKSRSLEGTLLSFASQCGIVNLGLDERDYVYPIEYGAIAGDSATIEFLRKANKPKTTAEADIDYMGELVRYLRGARDETTLLRVKMIALYSGLVQLAWAAILSGEAVDRPPSRARLAVDLLRNLTMAENMDSLLKACDAVGLENQESPPKCFFAIGLHHLIPTRANPLSVVELLAKKGWTVEMPPEKINAQFPPSSHVLTREEAGWIGELLQTTHRNPLFNYQTGLNDSSV